MKSYSIFITALMLGIIDGVSPGPVSATIYSNLFQKEFKSGLATFGWASFFEVMIAGAFVLLFELVNFPARYYYMLGACGGLLLVYFGITALKNTMLLKVDTLKYYTPIKVLAISVLSPWIYLAWSFVYFPFMYQARETIHNGGFYFFILLECGWILATFSMLILAATARKFIKKERTAFVITRVLAVIFIFFGIKLLWTSAVFLVVK